MLLDKCAVAARALCSTQTLDRLCRNGRGPVITSVGKRIFFTEQDVSLWLASCRQSAADKAA
jgi:hypothetical protein